MQSITIKLLIMFTFVYWNIVLVCVESKHRLEIKDFGPNIVGGNPVPLESFPYMVQFINLSNLCGGVILNSWSVLTSAHCFDNNKNIDNMKILVGSRYLYDSNARRYEIKSFGIHENYSKEILYEKDIAIIFLKEHLTFGELVKKAILVNHTRWMDADAEYFIVAGWVPCGSHKYQPYAPHMDYVPTHECSRLNNLKLSDDMFCLYGYGKRDTCRGDSGGGVLWHGTLVGLTSYGHRCAKEGKPSVYTNVWYMRKWIMDTIDQFIEDLCSTELQDELFACSMLKVPDSLDITPKTRD